MSFLFRKNVHWLSVKLSLRHLWLWSSTNCRYVLFMPLKRVLLCWQNTWMILVSVNRVGYKKWWAKVHEFYSLRLYLPSVVAMLKHACLTFSRVKSCSWLSWVGIFSVTPGECWDSTLKQAIDTFFLILTNSQFMNTLPIKWISLTLKPSNIIISNPKATVKPQLLFYCQCSGHMQMKSKHSAK